MVPILSNCPADHITARSISYIRTKMTKLRDESMPSGQLGVKHPEVLHESHTQSTDAPDVPPPPATPDGVGDVLRVSRYCERLVQQDNQKIHDNSVIAECFEVFPPDCPNNSYGKKSGKPKYCCQKPCCRNRGQLDESVSDMTFFTAEDAVSLQEMVDHLPFGENNFVTPAPRSPSRDKSASEVVVTETDEANYEDCSIPQPSAKQVAKRHKTQRKSPETSAKSKEPLKMKIGRSRIRGGIKVLPDLTNESSCPEKESEEKKKGVRFEQRDSELERKENMLENGSTMLEDEREKPRRPRIKKLKKKLPKSVLGRAKKYAPSPSSRSEHVYDQVAEVATDDEGKFARSQISDLAEEQRYARPSSFRGIKVKLGVFGFILLTLMMEIYFFTDFEIPENKFHVKNEDGRPGRGAARMSSAFLTSVLGLAWYPLFTVHMIALTSYLLEYVRLKLCRSRREFENFEIV